MSHKSLELGSLKINLRNTHVQGCVCVCVCVCVSLAGFVHKFFSGCLARMLRVFSIWKVGSE